ncbi:MAG: transglycosylase domain-containing protein [Bacteroidota bacterium]
MVEMTPEYKKKAVKVWWIVVFIPIFLTVVLFTIISSSSEKNPEHWRYMPTFEELENPESNLAAEIISADQKLLGKYYRQNRTVVKFENLPPVLVNALVATEDVRYYDHSGIDARGLFRVLIRTVLLGQGTGGGSTITQQLAKNLFPRDTKNRSKLGRLAVTIFAKLKEWVIAVKLERNYTKEEIMAMYLNTVEFGSQAFGIKSAARTFFDKSPDSLKLEEAAVLVGVLQAPSRFNPVRNTERSKTRRNTVLGQMKKYGFITQEVFDSTKALPLITRYNVQSHSRGLGTYFREYLRKIMTARKPERKNYASYQAQKFKEDSLNWGSNPLYGWCNRNKKPNGENYNLYSDGLKIYTTINSRMQHYAEQAVKEHMGGYLQPLFFKTQKGRQRAPFHWKLKQKQIDRILYLAMRRSERYRVLRNVDKMDSAAIIKNFNTPTRMHVFSWKGDIDTVMTPIDSIRYYKYFLHAGLMSMEPQTGYVRAYVGDINYRHFKFDNVMIAKRQVGSTFKPIIYTIAMMPGGFSPCHKIPNIPVTFKMPEGQSDYTPRFSPSSVDGEMITLKTGLAKSLNQVSAWIMKQYNPATFVQLARKMGIVSKIPEVPSICVGASEIRLAEMVAAYDTYINKGVFVEPIFVTRIEDKNGNIISTFKPKKREVISEGTAYRMLNLMQGVTGPGGTSYRLRFTYNLNNEIAGKTGTTNDNSDGWFIGLVPNLVTGVWVGGEERSIRFASGAYGQGSSMALPIWAHYMREVYIDEDLGISKARFEVPDNMEGIEIDCSKYKEHESEFEEIGNPENDIF